LTAANNSTVTLPSVAKCAGKVKIIRLSAVGSGTLTVADLAGDAAFSDVSLTVAGNDIVVYCDGEKWNFLKYTAASGGDLSITSLVTSGDITPGGSVIRTGQQYVCSTAGARAGATAGWVVTGADVGQATLPASQTASTMVIPVNLPLKVGSTITAYSIIAQIESAGQTVTIDAALYKITNAAGDPTSADIGSITQVSVTADTASAASKTLAAPEVVAAGETFYLLITATTGSLTDIQFQGYTMTISEV